MHDFYVSTQTFLIKINNDTVDLLKLFQSIEINNEIIYCKFGNSHKKNDSLYMKTKIKPAKKKIYCLFLIINLNKQIFLKIFKNGIIQLTGCKNIYHVKKSLYILKDYFEYFQSKTANNITFLIKSIMKNVNFNILFPIKKQEFYNKLLNFNNELLCFPSLGNTMDIKLFIPINLKNYLNYKNILQIVFEKNEHDYVKQNEEYFNINYLRENTNNSKDSFFSTVENKKSTLVIFQNGKIILSSVNDDIILEIYNWFIKFINKEKKYIKYNLNYEDYIFTRKQIETYDIKIINA
jgi:TATA-box binding protein (TBP) (component of TFIID and TFIIIB)